MVRWLATPAFFFLSKLYALFGNWGAALLVLHALIWGLGLLIFAVERWLAHRPDRIFAGVRRRPREDALEVMVLGYRPPGHLMFWTLVAVLMVELVLLVDVGVALVLFRFSELRGAAFWWIDDLTRRDPTLLGTALLVAFTLVRWRILPRTKQGRVLEKVDLAWALLLAPLPAGLTLLWLGGRLVGMAHAFFLAASARARRARRARNKPHP